MQVSGIESVLRRSTRALDVRPSSRASSAGLTAFRSPCGIRSDWAAQRTGRRAVLLGRAGRAAPGDPPPSCTICRVVHLWTTAAGQAVGILLSSAALGIAGRERQRPDGPVSAANGGTRRLCRPTRPGAQRRDRAERGSEGPCCQVPLCPFPLLPPSRCSTAGALAEAWNIRGNGLYTLDPYTPSPSAQRVYGSRRFAWSSHHLGVQPSCRPWQRRTGASSAPPRGTSGYPYGSSDRASATTGAARSGHRRTVLPQALQPWRAAPSAPRDLVASGCGKLCGFSTASTDRCTDRTVLVQHRIIVAPAPVAPRPRRALPHILVGARSRPGRRSPCRRATASWTHQKRRSPGMRPGSRERLSRPLPPASPSRLGLPPGAATRSESRALAVWTFADRDSLRVAEPSPSRSMRGPRSHLAFSLRSPCGPQTGR